MTRRFELHDYYTPVQLSVKGTVVERRIFPYGHEARFSTWSPCCHKESRIDARDAGFGTEGYELVTCKGCGWKWMVILTLDGERLVNVPRDAGHPQIKANRAEWISRGFGTRNYRKQNQA